MNDRRVRQFSVSFVCVVLLLASPAIPTRAQYEDDRLDDHEQQDRLYLERYQKRAEERAQPAETDDAVLAEAFIARAEELIRDKNYRSFTADRIRAQTDDPRVDPKAVVGLLEGFNDYFADFWRDTLELQPQVSLSRVFLFYSFYKYNQLLAGDWRLSDVRPKGHYLEGVQAITLHTDSAAASDLADVLIHENTHLLFGERLFTEGYPIPAWVNEGLASYFGYTYMDEAGRFHPGEIGGKKVSLMRNAQAVAGGEGKQRLNSLKKSMKKKTGAPELVDVTRIDDPGRFYSQPEWSYSASWILVHYLLHGDDGAHRRAFARYLVRTSQGDGGPQTLLHELRMSAGELETAATAHLKRMRPR